MKTLLLLCIVSCMVMVSLASPAKDLKEAKKEAANKKRCMSDCGSQEYKPVCAGKEGSKPLSFGSVCVMNNYNCEHNEVLAKISEGECPGGGSIRL